MSKRNGPPPLQETPFSRKRIIVPDSSPESPFSDHTILSSNVNNNNHLQYQSINNNKHLQYGSTNNNNNNNVRAYRSSSSIVINNNNNNNNNRRLIYPQNVSSSSSSIVINNNNNNRISNYASSSSSIGGNNNNNNHNNTDMISITTTSTSQYKSINRSQYQSNNNNDLMSTTTSQYQSNNNNDDDDNNNNNNDLLSTTTSHYESNNNNNNNTDIISTTTSHDPDSFCCFNKQQLLAIKTLSQAQNYFAQQIQHAQETNKSLLTQINTSLFVTLNVITNKLENIELDIYNICNAESHRNVCIYIFINRLKYQANNQKRMKEMALQKIEIANHYISYLIINQVWCGLACLGMQKILSLKKEPQFVSSAEFASITPITSQQLKQNSPHGLKKKIDEDYIGESTPHYFEKTIHAAVSDYCQIVKNVELDDLWCKYSKQNKIKEYFEETILNSQPRTENRSKKLISILQFFYQCRYKSGCTLILFLHFITNKIVPKFITFFSGDMNSQNLYSNILILFILKIVNSSINNFLQHWIKSNRGKPPRWYDIDHYFNQWKIFRVFIVEQFSNFTLLQREPRFLSNIQELQKWFIYSISATNTKSPSFVNVWKRTGEPISWAINSRYVQQQKSFDQDNWYSKYDVNHISIAIRYWNSNISFNQWNTFDTDHNNLEEFADALIKHINNTQLHIISDEESKILQEAQTNKKPQFDLFCGGGEATYQNRLETTTHLKFGQIPTSNKLPITVLNLPVLSSPTSINNHNHINDANHHINIKNNNNNNNNNTNNSITHINDANYQNNTHINDSNHHINIKNNNNNNNSITHNNLSPSSFNTNFRVDMSPPPANDSNINNNNNINDIHPSVSTTIELNVDDNNNNNNNNNNLLSYQEHIDKQTQWRQQLMDVQNKINFLPSEKLCPYTIPKILKDIEILRSTLDTQQQQQLTKEICEKINKQPSFWHQAKGTKLYLLIK